MPLIRRGMHDRPLPAGAADARARLLNESPAERWKAARDLAFDQNAVPDLTRALATETAGDVREAIFTSLMRIGTSESARAIVDSLRSDDAALRTSALDALGAMPETVAEMLPTLLGDDDADVRILVCELARPLPAVTATRLLGNVLQTDLSPNVCGAAVEVLSEAGTPEAIPALEACRARFPTEQFLGFAIDDAISRLGEKSSALNE